MRVRVDVSTEEWQEALDRFPPSARDVFFGPAFHALHVANGDGRASCSIVDNGDRTLLIPGIRAPVPLLTGEQSPGVEDLQTCGTGYGGPLAAAGDDPHFIAEAWRAWREEMASRGVVAAFFRLHPLLNNRVWLPDWAVVRRDRQTVYVEIESGLDISWKRATSRHRNMVRKATRERLVLAWNQPDAWQQFESLYREAMRRLHADDRFVFNRQFFDRLRTLDEADVVVARDRDRSVAASVFVSGVRWSHYYLSARSAEAGNYVVNAVLHVALERLASRGLAGLHLGGGRTPAPDDALLRFKMALGGRLLPYEVALLPVQPAELDRLNRGWSERAGRPPRWLLGYRESIALTDRGARL